MATIIIRKRETKSFKTISIQCERIYTLHLKGYGSEKMLQMVEEIFFKAMQKNGGY